MTAQPSLFDPASQHAYLPAHPHDTQVEAAVSTLPISAQQRARVDSVIRAAGAEGCTDEEIQDYLGLNPSSERPRRLELVEARRVVDSGRRRKTRSGRNAIVWVRT